MHVTQYYQDQRRNIRKNEKYIGDVRVAKPQGQRKGRIEVSGGYLLTDNHPAIIPREIFSEVQKEKQRRSNIAIDENGKHRKETRYSAAKDITNKEQAKARKREQAKKAN